MSGEHDSVSTVIEPEVTEETQTRRMPPYNVVVLNDEDHTFEYVIEMLIKLFAHSLPRAKELTWEIHSRGRAIVYTTHKEKAELKRDQVLAYAQIPGSRDPPTRCGAISSRLSPAKTIAAHITTDRPLQLASGLARSSPSGQPASR